MSVTPHTEATRYRPAAARAEQVDAMAARIAQGQSVRAAGIALGLTPGETASTWRRIKTELGGQAV